MEYVTLGKTGIKISRLGFGGIPIQRVDASATKELIKAMVEKVSTTSIPLADILLAKVISVKP